LMVCGPVNAFVMLQQRISIKQAASLAGLFIIGCGFLR
jgi:hypothetical protein